MKPPVWILIPTLNEAHAIRPTLDAIGQRDGPRGNHRGYRKLDATAELAEQKGIGLVRAKERNRAIQMNEGKKVAGGDALLLLHADTLIARERVRGSQMPFASVR